MKVRFTRNRQCNLHTWRSGTVYESKKGMVFKEEWTNIKFSPLPFPSDDFVNYCDLREPLPFPDETFDNIYSNHVLEHLTLEETRALLAEFFRTLRPGGICRIVVPDLRKVATEYLQALETVENDPSDKNVAIYWWAVFDLFDQMVRDDSGGEMLRCLEAGEFVESYVVSKHGDVFEEFMGQMPARKGKPASRPLISRIRGKSLREMAFAFLRRMKLLLWGSDPRKTRESVKWMHDRFSLRLMMEQAGFVEFQETSYDRSRISDWSLYNFDKSDRGDYPLEPSLYTEAVKPGHRGV